VRVGVLWEIIVKRKGRTREEANFFLVKDPENRVRNLRSHKGLARIEAIEERGATG